MLVDQDGLIVESRPNVGLVHVLKELCQSLRARTEIQPEAISTDVPVGLAPHVAAEREGLSIRAMEVDLLADPCRQAQMMQWRVQQGRKLRALDDLQVRPR
ncbi:MAG: hypothetical protein JSR95_01040 [Proteobacteria bacterium]|nr:hypothetical protein [Pseudomonadota bacterium]